MSRKIGPEPWCHKTRKLWYLSLNGKQIPLGADKDKAFEKWHNLMTAEDPEPQVEVGCLADLFGASSNSAATTGLPIL